MTTIEEIREEIEEITKVINDKGIQTNVHKKRQSESNHLKDLEDKLKDPSIKKLVRSLKGLVEDELVQYDERINQLLERLGYEEQFPDFEGIDNPDVNALPGEEKIYWTELNKMLKRARNDGTTWKLEDLIDIIIEVKKHLGISDDELNGLTINADLSMPIKKVDGVDTNLTLKEVIDKANRYQTLNVVANDIIREKGEIDKGKLENIKNELNKIKNLLGIPSTSPLTGLINQVAKKSDLDAARNDLNKWIGKFLNKTPEQVEDKINAQKELINKMTKRLTETGMITTTLKNQIEVVNNK